MTNLRLCPVAAAEKQARVAPGDLLGLRRMPAPPSVWEIFLPGLLLVLGVLPFWRALRQRPGAEAALRGANATVVGVLLAALYNPVWTSGVTGARTAALAIAAFAALHAWKMPPWIVVLAAAGLGQAFL